MTQTQRGAQAVVCALVVFVLLGAPAAAHTPVSGIQGLSTGLLHPFSTPPQALLMLGLGLLSGVFALATARMLGAVFCGGLLLGVVLGWRGGAEVDPATYGTAVLACALAALATCRTLPLALVAMAVGGVCIGMQSVPDPGPMGDRVTTLAGSVLGAGLGLVYIFGLLHVTHERFTHPAVTIGLRVLAAWAGAIALVMLALRFAPGQAAV